MAIGRTIVQWSLPTLSIFLGFFFFFSGVLKLSPGINRDIHREIRRNFVQYAKFIPFAKELNIKISPSNYRLIIGYTEVICGLILAFVSGRIKQFINLFLILFMFGAIYTHHAIGDNVEKMFPAILMTALLVIRYTIYICQRRRQIQLLMTSAQQKHHQPDKDSKKNITKDVKIDRDEQLSSASEDKSSTNDKVSKKKKKPKKAKKVKEN